MVLSTYALCGVANISTVGMMIGGLSNMVPSQHKVITKIAFQAMIVGNAVAILGACIAGMRQDTIREYIAS